MMSDIPTLKHIDPRPLTEEEIKEMSGCDAVYVRVEEPTTETLRALRRHEEVELHRSLNNTFRPTPPAPAE